MKFNVMFVDNSNSVLESFQWIFMDEPYYLFSYDNPLDALSVIKTLEWAVIVVEQFMKEMDGLEFLKRIREHSPHTMGIIMTGYNEITEASDTLYPGWVYRFVKKPLDNREIKHAVKSAITHYERITESKKQAVP